MINKEVNGTFASKEKWKERIYSRNTGNDEGAEISLSLGG